MKIILDLSKSYNNYDWKDKRELHKYLNNALGILWDLQRKIASDENYETDEENRLYDILDIFEDYKIIETDYNEKVNSFKLGYLSMKELIQSLGIDLLERDIDDLKDIIKEYEGK